MRQDDTINIKRNEMNIAPQNCIESRTSVSNKGEYS